MSKIISEKKQNSTISRVISPGLYIVATPIGNLKDITLRALETLAAVDLILAEDTRVSTKLLEHYAINNKCIHFNDEASPRDIANYVERISQGQALAIISDAGTPMISDPGYRLIVAVREAGLPLEALPGACAVINALVLSGLAPLPFTFVGFLPHKQQKREQMIRKYSENRQTVICFESPRRLVDTLMTIAECASSTRVAVAREMTKTFEEVTVGSVDQVLATYKARDTVRGEIALVLEFAEPEAPSDVVILEMIAKLRTQGLSTREIASTLAKQHNISKNAVYQLALQLH